MYFASGTFFLAHSDLISLTKHVFDRSQVSVLYTDTLTLDTSASLKYRTNIFTLYIKRILPLLVLGNFVGLVLLALLAEGPAGFRDVHLHNTENNIEQTCSIHKIPQRGLTRPTGPSHKTHKLIKNQVHSYQRVLFNYVRN